MLSDDLRKHQSDGKSVNRLLNNDETSKNALNALITKRY